MTLPKVLLVLDNASASDRFILLGIQKYASLYGPWAYNKIAQSDMTRISIEAARSWAPDGVIVSNEQCGLDEFAKFDVPIIIAARNEAKREYQNVKYVDVRNDLIGEMGAEFFLKKGYKSFAFCGFEDYYWSHEREEAFRKRIEASHYNMHTYYHRRSQQKVENFEKNRQNGLITWLMDLPKPIGLMTCSDICASYVLDACRLQKLHVPEEIAVLGVGNDEMLAKLCNPQLSSVELDFQQVGYHGAELLQSMIMKANGSGQNVTDMGPMALRIRRSAEVNAIYDKDVANALKYIRAHVCELIQVQDVVNATTLSRRALYERFQKVVGHGIYTEIRNVRVEYIASMLIDTGASILDIARTFGYCGEGNFGRYFRCIKGMSPRKYRSLYHQIRLSRYNPQ